MNEKRKCFTLIWKIKNFSFCFNRLGCFDSPDFTIDEICGSKWNLVLFPNSKLFKDCIVCRLWRISGPEKLELDYEFSFLFSNGSVLISKIIHKKTYEVFDYHNSVLVAKKNDVFFDKKHLFIPDDTLTIRCRMWKSQEPISNSIICYVETRVNIECISFIGAIDIFSSRKPNSFNEVYIKSLEKGYRLSSVRLRINSDGTLYIQVKPAVYRPSAVYKFKVFIIDASGNKLISYDSYENDIFKTQPFCIPLRFSLKHLIENKELYLPNDELTLQCNVIFPKNHKLVEITEKIHYELHDYDCENTQLAMGNVNNSKSYTKECHTECFGSLMDDLISLFNEGILYDANIKTATETFPAHKVVLSARSPVFKYIFMNENRDCIELNLDAKTVRQMLFFMYKDTVENLDYESAKSLYIAANMYNIVSLRHRCFNFFKHNIQHLNSCDILLLADKYQDLELKKCVQDWIKKDYEAVLSSEEWKKLVVINFVLAKEVIRSLSKKN